MVINPVRETGMVKFRVPSDPVSLLKGSKIASHYIQPHIGGDLALLWGIAKAVKQLDALDDDYLQKYCSDVDQWRQRVEEITWEEIETKSGVPRSEVEDIARVYASSKRCVFAWTMGITHHAHGVQNVQAIANLALCRGMVGRAGCGLMPIRGHSNVQGIGSVGVTPKLKTQIFDALQKKYQLITYFYWKNPRVHGSSDRYELSFGFSLGGNLFGSI